jgi:hypothetical protein
MNATQMFARLGYSPDQMLLVYRDQVVRLEAKVAAAAIATEFGKGGPDGKRYDGKFYHQLVAQLEGARQTLAEVEAR